MVTRIVLAVLACSLIVAGAALVAWPYGFVAAGLLLYIELKDAG